MLVDLSQPRVVHVVAAGGAAMSAIARILTALGHRVTGSDVQRSPVVAALQAEGLAVAIGHDAANVPDDVDLVAVSTAIRPDNPEVVEARRRGVPVASRADVLAALTRLRRTISVSGSHGKTTTSSMVAAVLEGAGLAPSFLVGGTIVGLGTGSRWTDGDWFVAEADESDGTFLDLRTEVALVTNVEPDHLEHWGGFDGLVDGFRRFLASSQGPRLVCADDPVAAGLAAEVGATTYGTAAGADYRMADLAADESPSRFELWRGAERLGPVAVPMPGAHNARNGAAAVVVGMLAGASFEAAAGAMAGYQGVARRFERKGEAGGVTYVDDFAHLPTEVASTLATARAGGWRRVVAVFQPHRYSRTQQLWRDFADSFVDADVLVLTDVYSALEDPRPGVTGKLIVDAVLEAHPDARVAYIPRRDQVAGYVRSVLRPGDVCLSVGAGDIGDLASELLP